MQSRLDATDEHVKYVVNLTSEEENKAIPMGRTVYCKDELHSEL